MPSSSPRTKTTHHSQEVWRREWAREALGPWPYCGVEICGWDRRQRAIQAQISLLRVTTWSLSGDLVRAPGTTDERAAKFKLGNQVKSWSVRAAGSARRSPPAGEGPHTPRPRGAGPSGYSCAQPAGPGGVPVPRENRSLSPPGPP